MSKNRRKKSSKCPEPFNTLIDLAATAALNYIGYRRRQKHGGKKKNKIDSYAAAGVAMGMGKLNSTEDVIRLGGFLGAMGAFDDDNDTNDYSAYTSSGTASRRVYQPSTRKPSNKNRYAWRMNCENGSAYGIHPEHYETRDEYNVALKSVKGNKTATQPQGYITEIRDMETECQITRSDITVCKVSRLDNGNNHYCKTNNMLIKVGDTVSIVYKNDTYNGVVISIEKISSVENIEVLPEIVDIITFG